MAVAGVIAGCVQVAQQPISSLPSIPATAIAPGVSTTQPSLPGATATTQLPPTTLALATPANTAGPTVAPGVAGAGSLVFISGFNLWLSAVDGSVARQLTSDGTDVFNYHDPSQADDGTIFVIKGLNTLLHLDRKGQPLAQPATLPTLEHGAEGVAVSPDGAHVAYTTVGTGQYIDPRFGTPTGTFLYGGSDIANPDGSSVPGAVMAELLYPTWVGPQILILADGVDLYYDNTNSNPIQRFKWFSEQDGCLTDFDCLPGQDAAASLSTPTISDDGTVLVYGYSPYYGDGGRRMASVAGGPPGGSPDNRCLMPSATAYTDNGSLNADGSLFFYDDTAFDSTTFETALGQGTWVIPVDLNAEDCGAARAMLVVPGGSQPDWGPVAP